jgi:hypothetical protein
MQLGHLYLFRGQPMMHVNATESSLRVATWVAVHASYQGRVGPRLVAFVARLYFADLRRARQSNSGKT